MSAVLKRVTIDLVLKSYSMLISYTVKLGCYNNIFKCKLYIQKMTLKKINIQQLLLYRPECNEAYCSTRKHFSSNNHLFILHLY